LRPGVALENAAVLELDGVEALLSGMRVKRAHLGAELFGVFQLLENMVEGVIVASRGKDARRDAPHLRKLLVVGGDLPQIVDDQNPVGRGLERRTEQRQGLPVIDLSGPKAPALFHCLPPAQ